MQKYYHLIEFSKQLTAKVSCGVLRAEKQSKYYWYRGVEK